VWRIVKFAARAAAWRTTPEPPLAGLPTLLGFAILAAAIRIALQLAVAESWHAFNPYGLNAAVAWLALELVVTALFVPPAGRGTALSALLMFSVAAEVATTAIKLGLSYAVPVAAQTAFSGAVLNVVTYGAAVIWLTGAMICVLQSFAPLPRRRALGRIAALWLALLITNVAVPHAPVFLPPDFDARTANWWETLYAIREAHNGHASNPEVARLQGKQQALLKAEIDRLAPQRPGVTDVYTLGIAGWGEQDVFRKELDGGLQVLETVLPIKDHVVRLINNRETLDAVPLANLQNFKLAVHAIAGVMDKSEDVFVLVMTSHGEKTGFALEVPGGVTELTPKEVADALDGEGIKNRVVIVSACFSGVFVPPLANDDTIVITAADANNTSFGCAPENDWTYFGDAFFRQSFHPGSDFESSFEHARVLISGWELMDRAAASNPQGHFGPAVVAKLAPYFATNPGQ
jgi:hypothetical protein